MEVMVDGKWIPTSIENDTVFLYNVSIFIKRLY